MTRGLVNGGLVTTPGRSWRRVRRPCRPSRRPGWRRAAGCRAPGAHDRGRIALRCWRGHGNGSRPVGRVGRSVRAHHRSGLVGLDQCGRLGLDGGHDIGRFGIRIRAKVLFRLGLRRHGRRRHGRRRHGRRGPRSLAGRRVREGERAALGRRGDGAGLRWHRGATGRAQRLVRRHLQSARWAAALGHGCHLGDIGAAGDRASPTSTRSGTRRPPPTASQGGAPPGPEVPRC